MFVNALLRASNHGKGGPLSVDRFKLELERMYSDCIHVATLLRFRVYLTNSASADEGDDSATYKQSGDTATPPWKL
jgi:hypothetical protein